MVAVLAGLTLFGACSQSSTPQRQLAVPTSLENGPASAPRIPVAEPVPVEALQAQQLVIAQEASVPIFLVMIGDDGAHGEYLGCGDSLVVYQAPNPGGASLVEQALSALFAQPATFPGPDGELTNIVRGLAFESASVANDVLTVRLSGEPLFGGMCDAPRFQAQVERTALAAAQLASTAPASSVVVLLNGSVDAWDSLFNFKGL